MQISRLLEMVHLLMEKRSMTAAELAARFEVSTRTILRDVEALAQAGIPVYTAQGKGGGISIVDRYVLSKTLLSGEEQQQILFALQGMAATGRPDANAALGKLRTLFAQTEPEWITVDFSRWGHTDADQARFEQIKSTIVGQRALAFTYDSAYGENTRRTVFPLRLVFKFAAWYLQAFCVAKQGFRTFKVNRMRDLAPMQVRFDRGEYPAPEIEADSDPDSVIELKLRFHPSAAYRAFDEFDAQHIHKEEDGMLLVTARLPDDAWLYGYLLSLGDAVDVLSPTDVRQRLAEQADRIAAHHRKEA